MRARRRREGNGDYLRRDGRMKKLSTVAMVAVSVYLGAMTAAAAAPITYDLIGVSAYFAPYFTDTLTGTFTFDPSTDITDSANIEVSGPVIPGTYNRGLQLYPLNSIIQADGATPGPTSAQAVILFFSAPLGNALDDVYQIGFAYPVDNVCCFPSRCSPPASKSLRPPAPWSASCFRKS